MIQTRNQYLQFMLVMLAAWGISWGARFVMEQAVLLYGSGKNYLFFSHGTVLMYLLCVFLVYRRWIAPLPVVGQLRNVGVPWLVGAMAVVYVGVFLLGKALALPATLREVYLQQQTHLGHRASLPHQSVGIERLLD